MERLQKIISARGITSRRQAEAWITAGRVTVNGVTACLGQTADPDTDVIAIDGAPLGAAPPLVYLMLNKPRGFVTTLSDEQGRKDAAQLVADCGQRVYPVGRLDLYSEGLLLFTNDGALAQALAHPKGQVNKTYHLWVSDYYEGAEEALKKPIVLDGRPISPPGIKLLSSQGRVARFAVTIHEGRNRQIRRMCQAAGLTPTRLRRVKEGCLELGDLPTGKWRYLTPGEIEALRR